MKKLILFFHVVIIVGCSKDDEVETFLDKYNGTSWSIETEQFYSGNIVKEIVTFSNGEYFYNYYNSDSIELIEWDGPGTAKITN